MQADELAYVDAVGLAELVHTGVCTPAEVVEAAVRRIQRLNPSINALIHESFESARREAGSPTLPDGPLRGVPFAFKDILGQTAGDPYHAGMRLLHERGWTAGHDSFLASDLRLAGLVFVGRTNTPELAGSVTTEPLAYGPTRNPWNTERSPGGSSGGSAAAVAAGLVPAAHGNDMGGSIRIPASYCGLVGLKPSRGRTSIGPDFGDFWSGSTHEGVLTRTVRDTAAFLDVMAVPHPGDHFVAPPSPIPFLAQVTDDPGCLRIGLRTDLPGRGRPADPEHVHAAESVAHLLEEMGHRVETAWPAALDESDIEARQYQLIGVGFARELDRWGAALGTPIKADDVEPNTWRFAEIGRSLSATAYVEAQEVVQAHARRLCSWWAEGYDLLLTPTASDLPPEIGVLAPLADQPARLSKDITSFARPWNITGQPAISLPLARSRDGLPIGVQLVAAYGQEALLLRVASALERARPWRHLRPLGFE